jgi:hypothetical protein
MWVSKKCHWCCILKAELDESLFNVSILINVWVVLVSLSLMMCKPTYIPGCPLVMLNVPFISLRMWALLSILTLHAIPSSTNMQRIKQGQWCSYTHKDWLLMEWDGEWWKTYWTYNSRLAKIVWIHKAISPTNKLWWDAHHQQNQVVSPKRTSPYKNVVHTSN